ncbi:nucleotide kinase [Pectobacterium phage PP81]|uniref:Nucleotide kinase n=1 Tax=Pectobacterium phage PP81 TaxID=1927014 RepID=A0A1L7DRZ4_9CAUD|nr:nucleotide kinase [Pectobacterium phage PP81]APU03038.1 nucleotide kinase [Pectobacterium phage PP81]
MHIVNSRVKYIGTDPAFIGRIGTVTDPQHYLGHGCIGVMVRWDGINTDSAHDAHLLLSIHAKALTDAHIERPKVIRKGDYVKYVGSGVDFGKRGYAEADALAGDYDVAIKFDTEAFRRDVPIDTLEVIGTGVSGKCENQKDDSVKAPSHYMLFTDVESIEVIARSMTVAEFKGFCFGNVLKYRLRAGKKSELATMEQDLKKASFYQELFDKHKEKCYGS